MCQKGRLAHFLFIMGVNSLSVELINSKTNKLINLKTQKLKWVYLD